MSEDDDSESYDEEEDDDPDISELDNSLNHDMPKAVSARVPMSKSRKNSRLGGQ